MGSRDQWILRRVIAGGTHVGPFISDIEIISGPLPWLIYTLAAAVALALAVRHVHDRRARLRWLRRVVVAVMVGGGVGVLACWVIGDLLNAFDVSLSVTSRAWVGAAFAGIALAIVSLLASRARRRVASIAAIAAFVLMGAVGVNADFGQYTTVGSIIGAPAFSPVPEPILAAQRALAGSVPGSQPDLWKTWQGSADLPAHGIVGTIQIPATVSRFAAREALMYLPPAALVKNPPALPVLVMLAGQPGSPDNVFLAGRLEKVLDTISARYHGLAPIVVVPDQLSADDVNPMCVDSAIGNSATYLTVDVPAWIRANLNVVGAASAWGIGGFSQGGTCAIQLGAGYPELFGSILDVSGELEPKIGSPEATIAGGFAGDAAAYESAKPLSLITKNAPFTDTVAIFAVGELDQKYLPWLTTLSAAGATAGIKSTLLISPGSAHDWNTVRFAFEKGLPTIYRHMGLDGPLS